MTAPSHWAAPEGVDWARFEELAERYRGDPELRARLESGDAAGEVAKLGLALPPGVETRFVANTDEVFHLPLPFDPNGTLGDETLGRVTGGSTVGTAATVGSIGTLSTVPSCAACAGSIGSVGTAGSAA